VNIANAIAGFVLFMLIVNSGYTIVHSDLPDWVVYFYWLSPYAYALRALAVNEMTSPRWDTLAGPAGAASLGGYALEQFDFYQDRVWIWGGWVYMAAFFLVATQLSALGLARMHPPSSMAVVQSAREAAAARQAAAEAKREVERERAAAPPDFARFEEGGSHSGSFHDSRRGVSTRALAVARTLPFAPISLVWRDLCYSVPVPAGVPGSVNGRKQLLDHITGVARPGVLTALMGGTGAGALGCRRVRARGLRSCLLTPVPLQARRRSWTCWRAVRRRAP